MAINRQSIHNKTSNSKKAAGFPSGAYKQSIELLAYCWKIELYCFHYISTVCSRPWCICTYTFIAWTSSFRELILTKIKCLCLGLFQCFVLQFRRHRWLNYVRSWSCIIVNYGFLCHSSMSCQPPLAFSWTTFSPTVKERLTVWLWGGQKQSSISCSSCQTLFQHSVLRQWHNTEELRSPLLEAIRESLSLNNKTFKKSIKNEKGL